MAHKSEVGREVWAAEHAGDLHETLEAVEEILRGGVGFSCLFSQRMHSKGWQGSHTRSEPVSR